MSHYRPAAVRVGRVAARSIHRTFLFRCNGVRWAVPAVEGVVMRRHLPPVVAAAFLTATLQSVSPAAASYDVDGSSIRTWNEIAVTSIVSTVPPTPGPV